jgi:hypothetical protein
VGVCADVLKSHPFNNVTENIFAKIGANLHRRPDHPICIIKEAIYAFFDERHPGVFTKFDDLHPVVSAYAVRLACAPLQRRAVLHDHLPSLACKGFLMHHMHHHLRPCRMQSPSHACHACLLACMPHAAFSSPENTSQRTLHTEHSC